MYNELYTGDSVEKRVQPELVDLVGNADQLGVVLVVTVVVRVRPVLVLSHQVVASV